jgi:hypothetical protein
MPAKYLSSMKLLLALVLAVSPLEAQVPADLARERAQFAEWLATAPNSPMIVRGLAPIGPGIRIGPETAEIPLPGIEAQVREAGGTVTIEGTIARRVLPRNRITTIGPLAFFVSGPAGKGIITAYGGERKQQVPEYYPYDASKVFIGPLHPAEPRRFLTLALDGLEVEATEAGSVVIPDGSGSTRLRVYRIPDQSGEESDLMIYFRDGTSGKGSYPAGRFVSLQPMPDGKYRLDLNRAQNPFCAYRTVYPCPAPWPGNTLTTAVEAGEKYHATEAAAPVAP